MARFLEEWNYILRNRHVVDLRSEARAICSSVHPKVRFAGIAPDADYGTVLGGQAALFKAVFKLF